MASEPVVSKFMGDILDVVDKYSTGDSGPTVAEAVGALEIVKLSVVSRGQRVRGADEPSGEGWEA